MIGTNTLEEQVLEMMFSQLKNDQLEYLIDQKKLSAVTTRSYDNRGFLTKFSVPESCSPIPGEPSFSSGNALGLSPKLQHGMAFVLSVERGRLSTLRGYTFEEQLPEKIGSVTLTELLRKYVAKWAEHEKQAIRILIGDALTKDVIEEVLNNDQCQVNYTGYGYYATKADERLPIERIVFSSPTNTFLLGFNPSGFKCGYVIFIENKEFTLECFPRNGEPLPPDFRESKVEVRILAQIED